MPQSFVKLQGTGNDFILLDLVEHPLDLPWDQVARMLCDRHFGIGADGLLLRVPSEQATSRMRIFNADGSEPEICGNGIRCFVRYMHDQGDWPAQGGTLETGAGIVSPLVVLDSLGHFQAVQVRMGSPRVLGKPDAAWEIAGERFTLTQVSMGNPHAVLFMDSIEEGQFQRWGPTIATHAGFPDGTNVEFVQVMARDRLDLWVWERGVGATLACGTGACAAAVAAHVAGRCERKVLVQLPGGELVVDWQVDGQVVLSGPAQVVFQGTVSL